MSLTYFLKNKEVKERFKDEFLRPKYTVKKELLAEPLTKNNVLIGTAFDYLLRFFMKRHNPKAVTSEWISEKALESFEIGKDEQFIQAFTVITVAKERYNEFLDTGILDDGLIELILQLSKLDPIYRTKKVEWVDESSWLIDANDVIDMKNLIEIVPPEMLTARKVCILNPQFGKASKLVKGADVDLVLDDMIVDIKTTKNIKFELSMFNQLMGYYTLYKIGGIVGMPSGYEIKRLGIYFARHGYLHVMDIDKIVNDESFPTFVKWFKRKAKEIA